MEIQGEQILSAVRADVWRALNDAAVLQRCLPGCDSFVADGENRYKVAMTATVGPVRARFAGKLQLADLVPPTSYAMSFEGSGGVAGFGKGTATVVLDDVSEGTRLRYTAQAQVGGRLAQVGSRLIDGVTRRMADDFFKRFARELAAPQATATPGSVPTVKGPRAATTDEAPTETCTASASDGPAPSGDSRTAIWIAVLAAGASSVAAAVAVLAAVVAANAVR
jgi:carbon monoxide dehydrogenase subunit G